ncbi:CHAP domain-containing protein [Streptomyces huasconensis]|uniref:CHAP domain-containing protein n=1 Tax=Streptomyces huasconensis TaxID=1854574 RepID=UPI0033EF3B46
MGDAQTITKIAKAEIGYHEGRSGEHWNNHQRYSPAVPGLEWSQNQAWCATFVSWCAMKAGLAELYPRTASCLTGVSWYKQRGRFSEYPAIGAQVFFGQGGGTHTGLVVAFDADTITTVEGNTNAGGSAEGDGVYLKTRERRSSYVHGYGYPAFTEGVESADPAWKEKTPAKPTSQVVTLAPGVKPGARHPQVRVLQQLLAKAGFGPIHGAVTDLYGPETQKSVARFHDANPRYRSEGVAHDSKIGPSGFVALQKLAGRR